FPTLSVSANRYNSVLTLRPDIRSARHAWGFQPPRHGFNRVVGENAERRNDIFREVFVLIVAPDHDEVRLECVERIADLLQAREQCVAVVGRARLSLIWAPLVLDYLR